MHGADPVGRRPGGLGVVLAVARATDEEPDDAGYRSSEYGVARSANAR